MKKCVIVIIVVAVVCIAGTYLVQQYVLGPKKVTVAGDTSFDEVTAKLDPGGDFYMYMNTEKIVGTVEKLLAGLKEVAMTETAKNPAAQKEAELGFNVINQVLKSSGLFEIAGLGISSVPIGEGFNHDTIVVYHPEDKGEGLIWHMSGEKPHGLDALDLLPENTVFAHFSDSNLKYLWEWVTKEAEAAGIPKLSEGIKMIKPMLQQRLGIDLDKLLDSYGGHDGIILTLDESKQCQIPVGGFAIEIPDPALAIVVYVKDDAIFSLLQKFVPMPGQDEGGIKKIMGPIVPAPVTLQPMLVYKDNLLIAASNGKIVDEILAAQKGGKGLKDGEEFKKLSADMPDKGNSFAFLSARVLQTIYKIQEKAMAASPAKDKEAMGRLQNFLLPKDLSLYSVSQVTDEGFITTSNNNLGMGGAVILPALAVAGIVAAVAVPNLLTAMQKGKQKATMGDMKSISAAIEAYIADKGRPPQGKSLAEIKDRLQPFYIKVLPLKDAWGHDLLYSASGSSYFIASSGKDGVFNGWGQKGFFPAKEVKDFALDIILSNGMFLQGPQVK